MSALLKPIDNIIQFEIPKRPKIVEKEAPPDLRKFCVLPLRAIQDKELTHGAIRVLAILCAYCNRAGITWVGQQRLADDLQISKQAVNKQIGVLKRGGYIETVKRGFRGKRGDTLRVIFDKDISTEDAIAITSGIEDTRPPHLIRKEQEEMDRPIDNNQREQARKGFREMVRKMTTMDANRIDTSEKPTDSITVREMKAKIRKAQTKSKKTVDKSVDKLTTDAPIVNPQVDSIVNPGVDQSQFLTSKVTVSKEVINNLINKNIKTYKELVWSTFKIERQFNEQDLSVMKELIEKGLTEQMWIDVVSDTLATMKTKRQDPPHRIGWFRDGLMRVLDTSAEYL